MGNRLDITASIVLYNEDLEELKKTINCFLTISLTKKLYLIDNTLEKRFANIFNQDSIEYISVGKNIGFGSGHNRVLKKIKEQSKYHLILNPDVLFKEKVIHNLIDTLKKDDSLAMIAPKVLFPDKSHQYSCRRYPSALELIIRRFTFLKSFLNPSSI